ncbi:MAG: DUF4426 domain-containing protein [Gammaproteobacteria bacterium]|nr:DUF4426 domain-containing protein [Gammaproteobacteria bacterium]
MNGFKRVLVIGLSSVLVAACGQAPAPSSGVASQPLEPATASSRTFGDYELHFVAIRTDRLTPEVARSYDITRSPNRALLNVSILKKAGDGPGTTPVAGKVKARAVNLNGQLKDLTLRELRDGDAVYYIGDVAVANEETLVFTVEATPADGTPAMVVRFQREFFSN